MKMIHMPLLVTAMLLDVVVATATLPPSGCGTDAAAANYTILMLDDNRLHYLHGLERKIGEPELRSTYRDGIFEGWGDPLVFPVNRSDPGTKFRMIYSALPSQDLILMLESDDAQSWAPVNLSSYPTREPGGKVSHNRTYMNEVMRVQWSPGSPDGGGGMSGAFDDDGPDTPPEQRFKMLIMDGHVLTSPDAIAWSDLPKVKWQGTALDTAGEPPAFVFWEPIDQQYVFTSRAHGGDRRVYLHSIDKHWNGSTLTRKKLAIQADAIDSEDLAGPLAEFYGMPVTKYAGYYIGFLWVKHCPPFEGPPYWVTRKPPATSMGCRVETQLAYSMNGRGWVRSLRQPLFGNGPNGSATFGLNYAASMLVMPDDSLRVVAAAGSCTHGTGYAASGRNTGGCNTSILTYSLRPHGLMYMTPRPGGAPGVLGTRTLVLRGQSPRLFINADARGGAVRVQLGYGGWSGSRRPPGYPLPDFGFAEAAEFRERSSVAWEPTWGDGAHPRTFSTAASTLATRLLTVQVELTGTARLYALVGDFVPWCGVEECAPGE